MPSWHQKFDHARSSTFFITTVICYAVFVDQLFFAFILPVLPYSLKERNGVAENEGVQYWTTMLIVAFGVACLIACPLTGWWADRNPSRRLPFLTGLIVLLVSTLLMWLAKPMSLQVISRLGQGAADAIVYVVGMTIILDTVDIKHIAEFMGYLAWALNVGTFVGPLLGGVVYDRNGYHAVWWMMLGFVLLDVLLRIVMLEKGKHDNALSPDEQVDNISQLDHWQLSSMQLSLPCKTGISVVESSSLSAPSQFHAATTSSTSTSRTSKLPALLMLMKSMRMIAALYGICVQSMIFSGFETVVSLYVQEIWGYTSRGAGLMFIPLTLPAFFGPLLGRIIDRTTPRWALVSGFIGLCPVLVACQYVQYNSIGHKVLLCGLLFLVGLGITVTLNPLMAEISYIADDAGKSQTSMSKSNSHGGSAYAQAYALFAMAWSIGNIAGPLWTGLIKDEAGWRTMCWALGILSGTTAIPCFIWSGKGLKGWPFSLRHRRKGSEANRSRTEL